MFSNIVASVGVKYIIESHLSADRWSLTNKIFPELDEVFHCTRYGIRKLEIREVDNIFQQSKNDIYVLCPVYEFLFKRAVLVRPKFSRRPNLPECRMWPNVECSEVWIEHPKCGLNTRHDNREVTLTHLTQGSLTNFAGDDELCSYFFPLRALHVLTNKWPNAQCSEVWATGSIHTSGLMTINVIPS